jgi:HEAT repeat protein
MTGIAAEASCPGCRRPVHPLLGDVPLVLGDRVVMCCSEACRDRTLAGLAPPTAPPQAPDVGSEAAQVEPLPSASALPGERSGLPAAEGAEGVASSVALESPSPAESRRRRVLVSTLVGGGALLLVFAGYLILAYAYGGGVGTNGASLSDSVGRLRPAPLGEDAAPPPRPPARPPPRAERRPSLMTLKKRSWHMLEGFLASRTGRFWRTSARVLAEQGHAGALEALRKALKSPSWANRQRAAEALARLGHAEGLAVLKQDLVARRRPVQHASAFALARCGDPAGLRVIRQLARYRQHRMTAYEALVRLGDRLGVVQLQEALRKSRAPYDRLRAAVALGLRGDRAGLAVLRARMKEPGMHMGVALALQKLGAPEARDALVRALEHTALRVEAARALRAYGDVTLVAKMSPELGSQSEDSRLTAAAAIVILTSQARAEAR